MNRSNKIPEGRKRRNLVHSLCLRNEFTCHIFYLDLSLLASVVRLRIDINKHVHAEVSTQISDVISHIWIWHKGEFLVHIPGFSA